MAQERRIVHLPRYYHGSREEEAQTTVLQNLWNTMAQERHRLHVVKEAQYISHPKIIQCETISPMPLLCIDFITLTKNKYWCIYNTQRMPISLQKRTIIN